MKIPYSQLRSRSVTIEIHDLFILLGPSLLHEEDADADAEEQWYQKHKAASLAAREAMDLKVTKRSCVFSHAVGCPSHDRDGARHAARPYH